MTFFVWMRALGRHCRTCSGDPWRGKPGLSQNDSALLTGVSKHRNFGPKALDHRKMGAELGKLVPLARFIHTEWSKNRGLWLPVLKHYVT